MSNELEKKINRVAERIKELIEKEFPEKVDFMGIFITNTDPVFACFTSYCPLCVRDMLSDWLEHDDIQHWNKEDNEKSNKKVH